MGNNDYVYKFKKVKFIPFGENARADVVIKSSIPFLNIREQLLIAQRRRIHCRKCKERLEFTFVTFSIVGPKEKSVKMLVKFCPLCSGEFDEKASLSCLVNGHQFQDFK